MSIAPRRRIMKEFSILEISGVDQPAQAPALMSIMKSRSSNPATGEPGTTGQSKEDTMSKTPEELQAELTKANDLLAAANKAKDDADEKAKKLELLSKMTDAEKAAMENMDEEETKKFLAKSSAERTAQIEMAKSADPVVFKSAAGVEYRKSDDQRVIDMAKRDDVREVEMQKMRDAATDSHFEKTAGVSFAKFKGELTTKAALAKAVAGIKDEDVRKNVGEMLDAVHKSLGVMFKEVGHMDTNTAVDDADGDIAKAAGVSLDTMAKAKATADKISIEKAYSAVLETPEGQKLYAQSNG
jgi:uncharacterized protein YoxC